MKQEVAGKKRPGPKTKIPDEVKTRWVKLVNAKRAEGMSIEAACKAVSKEEKQEVHKSIYLWWDRVMRGIDDKAKKKEKLAKEMGQALSKPFAMAVSDHSERLSLGAPSSHPFKATVDGVTFEGTREEVMHAIAEFRKQS
jgi:hypothetical protein